MLDVPLLVVLFILLEHAALGTYFAGGIVAAGGIVVIGFKTVWVRVWSIEQQG